MSTRIAMTEFRTAWLPHATTTGLSRLADLLEQASPMLIHGAFSRAMPQGCLATHIAWNHPTTSSLQDEAGVIWLTRVAKLNPATSKLVEEWDRNGIHDWELRSDLLVACRQELDRREHTDRDELAQVCQA